VNKTGEKIRVGSRQSLLAIKQAEIVMDAIRESVPSTELELVTLKTTGDKVLDRSLDKIGGKGLFVKELELALLDGVIDIAVHSYKDMPHEEKTELPIVALSERDSPFDVLVLPEGVTGLDASKPVGSSSHRRRLQFAGLYPGVPAELIRGNILTRLEKLDEGGYSALVVAQAGLNRLALQHRISRIFSVDEMIPSAAQGILAVQGRAGEDYSYLNKFHSRESEIVSRTERQFLRTLGGGCSSPVAAYAVLHGTELLLTGMYVDEHGNMETGKISGSADEAEKLGERLASRLRVIGGEAAE